MSDFPLNYLTGYGARALAILPLTKGMIAISSIVTLVVALLLLGAIFRSRAAFDPRGLVQDTGPLRWVYLGAALTVAALAGVLVWTMTTMAAAVRTGPEAALSLEVTGRQWWWEVRYLDRAHPSNIFTTANEIHIPIGKFVRVDLRGGDVSHSFWVPALGGKTDMIPGQVNTTWLQADKVGSYRGQCSEYCGKQHAHMAFTVIAESEAQFEAWRTAQLRSVAPADPEPSASAEGRATFQTRCGACHTVRGTSAGGRVGPDLTHVMSRGTIAAGTLPNTLGSLAGWVADPQHLKPGAKMPVLEMSGPEIHSVTAYLATLN